MKTDVFRSGLNELPVTTHSDFTDVDMGGYIVSFRKIGSSIVHIKTQGSPRTFDKDHFTTTLSAFLAAASVQEPVVEIYETAGMFSSLLLWALGGSYHHTQENSRRIAGRILIHRSGWVKAINTLHASTDSGPLGFVSVKNFRQGLKTALEILNERDLTNPVPKLPQSLDEFNFNDIVFNPAWQLNSTENGYSQKIGVIPERLLLIRSEGVLRSRTDIEDARTRLERAVTDGKLTDKHYASITDLSEMKSSIDFKLRFAYANMVHQLLQRYRLRPNPSIVCGTSIFYRTAVRLLSPIMGLSFVFVDTLDQALSYCNGLDSGPRWNEQVITVNQSHIDEIANFVSAMLWADVNRICDPSISPGNPLVSIREMLQLVRSDLQNMRKRDQASALKRLEESEAIRKRLLSMIEDAEITKQALAAAKEAAEMAAVAKSDFLSNMSHEIRTPLNAILGMLELLSDDNHLTVEQQRITSMVRSSGNQLLGIINDTLDMSRIESGRLSLEEIEFDITLLLEEICSGFEIPARQKSIVFTHSCGPRTPRIVKGDPVRLRQILTNLISNALKFTDAGAVSVMVDDTTHDVNHTNPTDRTLLFTVTDTGIGIPDDKIGSLFTKFTQVDPSTTRKYGGTGLGLSIVKKLAELMNGEAGVRSKLGEGSQFWFTATFKRLPAHSPRTETCDRSADILGKFIDRSYRVLLVEDNVPNQFVARGLLNKLGISQVDVLNDGTNVVGTLKSAKYDIVLMDCQMPVMDGYEATKRVRIECPVPNRQIPVIAMTAYAMPGDREKCLAAGMNDYISKPISLHALYDVMRCWLPPPQ